MGVEKMREKDGPRRARGRKRAEEGEEEGGRRKAWSLVKKESRRG